ncbi:MAG: hypothetical protein WC790_03840 [Candidatus Paceibacterota bacterium]|jgi:hypothetical protein
MMVKKSKNENNSQPWLKTKGSTNSKGDTLSFMLFLLSILLCILLWDNIPLYVALFQMGGIDRFGSGIWGAVLASAIPAAIVVLLIFATVTLKKTKK